MNTLTERLRETNFPSEYELLPTERPINTLAPVLDIPVIDMIGLTTITQRQRILDSIMAAAKEFGMFQIINHEVSTVLMGNAMRAATRFFELPTHVLRPECQRCAVYSSSVIHHLQLHNQAKFWRDTMPIYLSSQTVYMPDSPPRFKIDVPAFASSVKELAERLISLISEGLGLHGTYFHDRGLTTVRRINVNRYPRCPNPSLTCGLPKHCDPDLLTITLEGNNAHGLQIYRGDQWWSVNPRQNALIVTLGNQMQVVSNGILKAPAHRVIVNSQQDRTSICYAIAPSDSSDVEPADDGLPGAEPKHYRKFSYYEYRGIHMYNYRDSSTCLSFYESR